MRSAVRNAHDVWTGSAHSAIADGHRATVPKQDAAAAAKLQHLRAICRRKESTNSWRYRIFPTANLDSPASSFESPGNMLQSPSAISDMGTQHTSVSPQRSSQALRALPQPSPPLSPTPAPAALMPQLQHAPRSKSSPSALKPPDEANGQSVRVAAHGATAQAASATPDNRAVSGRSINAEAEQHAQALPPGGAPVSAPSSSARRRTLPTDLQRNSAARELAQAAPDAAAAAAALAAQAVTQQGSAYGHAHENGHSASARACASHGARGGKQPRSCRTQENSALNGRHSAAQPQPVQRRSGDALAPPRRGSAEEARVAREAWNWRFARKWILERNRAGTDLDDEGKAFQAILAGELTDKDLRQQAAQAHAHAQAAAGRASGASLSRGATLSESLMFPAEHPLQGARSGRTSMQASIAQAKEQGVRY